ncbi:MAG TPA: hypothetical protein DCF33_19590 [Saprospirales bacterium]|nr:hypothetical protein [Saprospirales bacterium]
MVAQEILTNSTIIDLVKVGLDDEIITAKIKSSYNQFSTDTDSLLKLKASGVSNLVISSMLAAASNPNLVYSDPNDILAPHSGGIYYLEGEKLKKLEYTAYTGGKSSGRLLQNMTYGLTQTKNKLVLGGANSRQHFSGLSELYFYAETSDQSSFSGYDIASPNSFVLVKLDKTSNTRELEIGSANIIASNVGINGDQTVQFDFDEIAAGIYRVYFSEALAPGEYAFLHAAYLSVYVSSGMSSVGGQNRAFDFSIE